MKLNLLNGRLLPERIFTDFTVKRFCDIMNIILPYMGLFVCSFWRCLLHVTCCCVVLLAHTTGIFLGVGYTCCLFGFAYSTFTQLEVLLADPFPLASCRCVELYWLLDTYFGALMWRWLWWWIVNSCVISEDDIWKKRVKYCIFNK